MSKRLLKDGFSIVYYYFYRRFLIEKGFRILLYHSVGTKIPYDTYGISISPALFRKHLDLINGKYRVVPISAQAPQDALCITFDDGYRDNLTAAAEELLLRDMPFTVFVTTAYIQSGSNMYLSREQLKELASCRGVTIGSHGITHTPLAECDDATLKKELYESRSYLEDIIGKPVTAISYPHGSVNRRVWGTAREAGYEIGACSRFGVNSADCNNFLLRRTEVMATDTPSLFSLKLRGASDWYRWRQKDLHALL